MKDAAPPESHRPVIILLGFSVILFGLSATSSGLHVLSYVKFLSLPPRSLQLLLIPVFHVSQAWTVIVSFPHPQHTPLAAYLLPKIYISKENHRSRFRRLSGDDSRTTIIKRLHEIYGEIVRLASDELLVSDPAAWRDIYPRNSFSMDSGTGALRAVHCSTRTFRALSRQHGSTCCLSTSIWRPGAGREP